MKPYICHLESFDFDGLQYTVHMFVSVIGSEQNREIKRSFMTKPEAVDYIQRECFWAYNAFFDRYSLMCLDIMSHPGEKNTPEKRDSIRLLRKAMEKAHEKKLHPSTVAQLVCNGKEHCERVKPSASHPLHSLIDSMLQQLYRDAKFFRDEFLKPDHLQFQTVIKSAA